MIKGVLKSRCSRNLNRRLHENVGYLNYHLNIFMVWLCLLGVALYFLYLFDVYCFVDLC